MLNKSVLFIWFLFSANIGYAQTRLADSLQRALENHPSQDSVRVDILNNLAFEMHFSNPVDSRTYSSKARSLAMQLNYQKGIALSYRLTGLAYWTQALYIDALDAFYAGLKIADSLQFKTIQADIAGNIGLVQNGIGNYEEALKSFQSSLQRHQELKNVKRQVVMLNNMGDCYLYLNRLDESLRTYKQSLELGEPLDYLLETNCRNIGNVYELRGDFDEAEKFYRRAMEMDERLKEVREMTLVRKSMASLYLKKGKIAEAERFAQEAIALAKPDNYRAPLRDTYFLLSKICIAKSDYRQALNYYQLAVAYKDSIQNLTEVSKFAAMQREHEVKQKQNEIDFLNRNKALKEKELSRTNWLLISTAIAVVLLGLLLYNVVRNSRFHKSVNVILRDRNAEISVQNNQLNEQKLELKKLNEELHNEREEVTAQRDILFDKTKQIEKLNIELSSMNYSLEQKVLERTSVLEIQNRALAEYAFINAHKLRAPVATILGLIDLLQRKDNADNYDQLVAHLKTTSEKLDSITRSISSKLEAGQNAFEREKSDE